MCTLDTVRTGSTDPGSDKAGSSYSGSTDRGSSLCVGLAFGSRWRSVRSGEQEAEWRLWVELPGNNTRQQQLEAAE